MSNQERFRVLTLRPPYTRLKGIGQAPFFPLGIGYLTAVLNQEPRIEARLYYPENQPAGESMLIFDKEGVFAARSHAQKKYDSALADNTHPVWQEVKEVLSSFKPHVVGLSVLTPEVGSAMKVSEIVREVLPESIIVWGGVHPTFATADTLKFPGVDYVVAGEGEESFRDLVLALQSGKTPDAIPGVMSSGNLDQPVNCRALIQNLDEIPMPSRDQVWFPDRFSPAALGSIMHSRGCPWRCGFCSSRQFWQERVRFRSADQVVDEISKINRDFGIRVFTFWDDAFTIDRQITEELCEAIIRMKPSIAWRTATRMDLLDDSMLRLLKRAGCVQLELGIESGSPRITEMIRKDIDLDRAPDIIENANRHGIACGVFLMAGFPDETREDLLQTLDFMTRIKPAEIVLNVFDPMPGSEQFHRCIELGLLPKEIDYSHYPLWPDAHFVSNMEPEEFNVLVDKISRYVFGYNASRTALVRRIKPEVLQLLRTDPGTLVTKGMHFIQRRLFPRKPLK